MTQQKKNGTILKWVAGTLIGILASFAIASNSMTLNMIKDSVDTNRKTAKENKADTAKNKALIDVLMTEFNSQKEIDRLEREKILEGIKWMLLLNGAKESQVDSILNGGSLKDSS